MHTIRKVKLGLMARGMTLAGLCGAIVLAMAVAGCGNSGNGSSTKAQGLWVPSYTGNMVSEFTGSALKTSGTTAATLTNSGADLSEPWGVAFDKKGNLWAVNFGANTITEYTASQLKSLKSTPAPAANVVISEANSEPTGLAFDKSGNLWVAYWTASELVEFTPSQLTASGSPTPTTTITSSAIAAPSQLQFDKSGNLWVANYNDSNVLEFTAAQLKAGGSPTPNLTVATSSIGNDYGIALDHSGNLWVANFNNSTVVEFAASDLATTGTITPAAKVTLSATSVTVGANTTTSLDLPSGLAFDRSGNLWVANNTSDNVGSLAKFTRKQIAADGSPSPAVFIDSDAAGTNIHSPGPITFGPSIK